MAQQTIMHIKINDTINARNSISTHLGYKVTSMLLCLGRAAFSISACVGKHIAMHNYSIGYIYYQAEARK